MDRKMISKIFNCLKLGDVQKSEYLVNEPSGIASHSNLPARHCVLAGGSGIPQGKSSELKRIIASILNKQTVLFFLILGLGA